MLFCVEMIFIFWNTNCTFVKEKHSSKILLRQTKHVKIFKKNISSTDMGKLLNCLPKYVPKDFEIRIIVRIHDRYVV